MLRILALAAFLAITPTAAADWPPCTCDPNVVTELWDCLVNDPDACPVAPSPDLPDKDDVSALAEELDPRDWPCTCDPQPDPW